MDDIQTIEERQAAVSNEENLEGAEDKSKLSFGINLNEIYGSEYQTEKTEEKSPVENIEEEIQIEEVSAIADEEQVEEEAPVENIEEEIQEEVPAIADESQIEEVQSTDQDSSIENII